MKTFLVINTSYFGDVLLTDPLCRNIKKAYPKSRLVFMANRPFASVARYMDGVDEAIAYDKGGAHKGVRGFYHFLREHRAKFGGGIDAAFVIYGNERGILLAKLLGARKIYSDNQGALRHFLPYTQVEHKEGLPVQDQHAALFQAYAGKRPEFLPMRYAPPKEAIDFAGELFSSLGIGAGDRLVALCATSKRRDKDLRVEECARLMQALRRRGRRVLFLGAGARSAEYVAELNRQGCKDFIDLTDRTTIPQLAAVAARCQSAVSVDTGTMHLLCALNIPVVAVFYLHTERHLRAWAPKAAHPHRLLAGPDFSAEKILQLLREVEGAADS